MITECLTLSVGSVEVEVIRKDIKNLHLGVYPPGGRVRVAAPAHMSVAAIRNAVAYRMDWIVRQRRRFDAQPRQSAREYVSGETHYFLGRGYRLTVIPDAGRSGVRLAGGERIEIALRGPASAETCGAMLDRWHRDELRSRVAPLIDAWSAKLGVARPWFGVKRMERRWGTCNPQELRVWLNLNLIRTPVAAIEYVVVHELAHFIERSHGSAFVSVLDMHLPNWRGAREMLSGVPYLTPRSGIAPLA